MGIYIYTYIYIYIYCAPPHVHTFFVFFTSFTYLVWRLGEHSLVLVVYLTCCLLVLLVLWQMGQHYSVLIRGPAGLDPIRGYWIRQDRRLKIEDAWESFWGIFNLQSSIQAGIGSNTRVFNFNTGPGQKLKIHWKVQHLRHVKGRTCCTFPKKPTP